MRDIKFRGKRVDNGEWIEGNYSELNGVHFITPKKNAQLPSSQYEVNPATVGQFTGLLDKNGKEIYEGDIIQVGHDSNRYKCRDCVSFIGDIKWNYVSLCWHVGGQLLCTLSTADAFYNIEVIGNIHDNPELL